MSHAQSLSDPRLVEFSPSADHDATLSNGSSAVTRYDLEIYAAGATAPSYTVDMAKPAPGTDGRIRYDFSSTVGAWAQPGVTYESRVAAVGPNGTARSAPSNAFTITAGGQCSYTIAPTSLPVGSASGAASISVTATAGCGWTASSGASWITVLPASGSGSGTATLSYAANTSTTARTGTVTVAGHTVSVTQAAAPCSFTVSPLTASVESASGTTSVSVSTTAGCGWTASSGASWISVSPASGSGSGTATLSFAANTATTTRSGTVTVAGKTVTVTQAAAGGCAYSVSPLMLSVGSGSGKDSVSVTTSASCTWSAASNASWIGVNRGSASGSRTIQVRYDANKTGGSRSGTLTVAGQTVTVAQAGVAGLMTVSTEDELQAAVASATTDTTIVLEAGTYRLTQTLSVRGAANVTLRGATGNRDDVVLLGSASAKETGGARTGVWSDAPGLTLADLTLRRFSGTAVVFAAAAQNPRLSNVRVADAGQLVRAETGGFGGGVNGGLIERSLLEYSTTGRDASASGLEIQGGSGWVVRANVFRNIRAPLGFRSRPALLAWKGSANTLVEGNRFVNCQLGIAFGAVEGEPDDHIAGMVRNNVIYRAPGEAAGGVGISVADSPNTQVLHNTVVLSGTGSASIETRWWSTNGLVANNLTDAPISQRDGAAGLESGNYTAASKTMFVNAAAGDLHLVPSAAAAVDSALPLDEVTKDCDGQGRSGGGSPDIGADELDLEPRYAPSSP